MAEAEETAATTPNPLKDVKEEAGDMESRIRSAMRSRVPHFKEQSDSLTFEGVRRLLEKDMGLETYALDVHKRFVKQCLLENLEGGNDANGQEISAEMGQENGGLTGEAEKLMKRKNLKKDEAELRSEDEDKMEDSPVMGLLTAKDAAKTEDAKSKHQKSKGISEPEIGKAIKKRSSYVKANSENITMAGFRRILEEDMKLEKHALDPYKVFISKKLDEVLKSLKDSSLANDKGKKVQKISKGRPSKMAATIDESDSMQSEDDVEEIEADSEVEDEDEEDEEKPRKKSVLKGKLKESQVLQKRKRPEKETKVSKLKKWKPSAERGSDNVSAEDSGNVSEEAGSHSSAEKTVKVKEAATPSYGKRVEHLKSVIKSCGMSVPPSVYRKAKQAPESKRESQLIKELEEILAKEGLSADPSEKEIKDVRKKKERAKELEGIDMSNIVTTARRRSVTSFAPPPKPKIPDESDGSDSDESGDNDEDDEDNDDNEGDEDEGNNDSHGEEAAEEDEGEDSD